MSQMTSPADPPPAQRIKALWSMLAAFAFLHYPPFVYWCTPFLLLYILDRLFRCGCSQPTQPECSLGAHPATVPEWACPCCPTARKHLGWLLGSIPAGLAP